jgi:glycogen debranching enzyme
MKFKPIEANEKTLESFAGALPTTIYREDGILEVYAQKPDIDSTALMISTTSWILSRLLLSDRISQRERSEAVDFLVPRMLRAVDYLKKRDIDNDGLLEQDHNEDWMDTILRRGKIVYSQASFILGLRDLSVLQLQLEHKKQARSMADLAKKTIQAVDKKLWSDEDNAYIDIQDQEEHIGGPYRTLTQDVALFLIAITENLPNGSKIEENSQLYKRADSTLETMKKRIWKDKWPLVTEVELKKSGPWVLKPNQYHNHTFWPWTTGIEMLARFRFNKIEDCNTLFSKLASDDELHVHTFYEWINPLTDKVQGAYPFRTGVSAVRIALFEILAKANAAKMNTG